MGLSLYIFFRLTLFCYAILRRLDLVLSQEHVGDAVTDDIVVLAVWADHLS